MRMRRLLVLGAGLLQIPVIKKAKEMGIYVLAADDDPTAPGLTLCDKPLVGYGIANKEAMLEVARKEKIDGVIHPCSEVAMNAMGYINDQMGLAGVSLETAIRATNKHLMREAFEQYGAPSPKSFCFTDMEVAWGCFCTEFPKDAILKPSRNSGSRGIARIPSTINEAHFAELFERAKDESRDKSVMLEQFVEGPEFSVEIIVWNGKVNVLQVTDKKTTEDPYFVELGHNQPSLFPQAIVDAVRNAAVMGVKALKVNNCACHAEVKVQDGEAYLMEIGARLGGDFISTELTHLSTGIDMVAAAICVALGMEPDLTPKSQPQGVCIRYWHPTAGKLVAIENEEYVQKDYVYQYEIYHHVGDMIPEVKSSLDRSGHVIVTAPTAKEAIDRAEDIISNIALVTKQ